MSHQIIDLADRDPRWAGQTVTIDLDISWAALQRLTATRASIGTRNAREFRINPQHVAYGQALVREVVVCWSLTGRDGDALPCTPEALAGENAPAALLEHALGAVMELVDAEFRPDDDDEGGGDPKDG